MNVGPFKGWLGIVAVIALAWLIYQAGRNRTVG